MRIALIPFALGACAQSEALAERRSARTVSAMNYAAEPIDPVCAKQAVLGADGFGLRGNLRRSDGAQRFEALFNDDLPLSVIVRRRPDASSEVSVFSRLPRGATPLDRREAEFAVASADEAIARACTEDGRRGGRDVVIEAE